MNRKNALMSLVICLLLSALSAAAQGIPTVSTGAELNIWVMFDNDHPVPELYRVQLLNTQHIPIASTITDARGQALFHGIREGGYHLSVSGPNTESAETSFAIYRGELSHNEYVRLNRKAEAPTSSDGSVS